MLQDTESVLDIPHDLTVILLVLLKELGVLLHLVVHLARERLDLVLQCGIEIMEFLLELKKWLEGVIVRRGWPRKTLENKKSCDKSAKRNCHGDEN